MLLAAIGSINGDAAALHAVLEAIADEGIFTIVHTGNAVAGGSGANEVLTLLQANGVTCVQGNLDRLVVRYSRKQDTLERRLDPETLDSIRRAHEELTSQNLEVVRDWRKSKSLSLDECSGYLCHGSPGNPREILTPETPLSKLQRQRETARADIIICGGSEAPFDRTVDGTLFVHPGKLSVEAGQARYTLISTEETPWTATVETVAY